MNLQKLIDKKDAAAKYMLDEITHICKTFEKRAPGSKGEEQACEYMAKVLKEECGCDRADVESFKENPGSFYGWIYFTITFVLLAIVLFFFFPLASILLIVAGLVIVFLQFGLYKKVVDPCFEEKTGHNVTAVKKCTGEVKRRRLSIGAEDQQPILGAHQPGGLAAVRPEVRQVDAISRRQLEDLACRGVD